MGRCAGAPKNGRSGEEGSDVTRAEVRGQAQQSSDKLLTLHLLQLLRIRWEPRVANGTRRGRARPGPWPWGLPVPLQAAEAPYRLPGASPPALYLSPPPPSLTPPRRGEGEGRS